MPQQLSSTHTIIPRALIVYKRERSEVWQCRIKVGERWIRRSTKERKLPAAIEKAKELMVEAEIRRRDGLPAITK